MSKRRIAVEDLTIRKKLFLVFGVLIVIFMANGIYRGIASTVSMTVRCASTATQHLQGVLAAADSSRALSDYRQGEYAIVTASTLPNRIHAAQEVKKLGD